MRRIRNFLWLPLIVYNWPILIGLAFLDAAKIDIRPQGKRADFSFAQTLVLFLVATFFSTLFYIVFSGTLAAVLRDYPVALVPLI